MPVDATYPSTRAAHETRNRESLAIILGALRGDVLARFDTGARTLLAAVWDREVADVVYARNLDTATVFGELVADGFDGGFDANRMVAWLTENARFAGENLNAATREALAAAEDRGTVELVLDDLEGGRADRFAVGMAATASNFGAHDAATQNGAATKTWQVNSGNPRSLHIAMAGETVPIDAVFGNGMRWPGDPAGGAENNANCQCSLIYT